MTSQGQTFFAKMFDLDRSPQVGQTNDPQNTIIKMGKLNGSLLTLKFQNGCTPLEWCEDMWRA